MPKYTSLTAYIAAWSRGFQYPPNTPLGFCLRDIAGVPITVLARYCDASQSAMSLYLSRSPNRATKRYRRHLDAALTMLDQEIGRRIKRIQADDDPEDDERMPDEIAAATVDLLQAYRAYFKVIGEWSER